MSSFESIHPEGVISGSFKFKPEIDEAINEFRDLNVIIRAPEIGWLYVPRNGLIVATKDEQFKPLPSEQHMSAGQVEAAFLAQLDQADFVYIMNPERYIGSMSVFEIGYSRGVRKPMYASHPIDYAALGIHDPKMIDLLRQSIPVMSPTDAAYDVRRTMLFTQTISQTVEHASTGGERLQLSSNHIAEGAITRCGRQVLLMADGRWQGDKLTIPGTKLRAGEQRSVALQRLVETKIGSQIKVMAHFATSFMLPESGYQGVVEPDRFVFDDNLVDIATTDVRPKTGVSHTWVSSAEIETLINDGQIEPNAATLLTKYLETAA